jgi:hypothetical protein
LPASAGTGGCHSLLPHTSWQLLSKRSSNCTFRNINKK